MHCKKNVRRVLCTGLLMLWMAAIFWFSAREAPQSEDMSHSAGRLAGHLLVRDFGKLTESEQDAFAEKIDYPIRKCAHASEYAVLGILLTAAFASYGVSGEKRTVISQGAGMLYAATDELHQLFVPGRSGQVSDVILDSAGVLLGVLISGLIVGRIEKKRSKNTDGRNYRNNI